MGSGHDYDSKSYVHNYGCDMVTLTKMCCLLRNGVRIVEDDSTHDGVIVKNGGPVMVMVDVRVVEDGYRVFL